MKLEDALPCFHYLVQVKDSYCPQTKRKREGVYLQYIYAILGQLGEMDDFWILDGLSDDQAWFTSHHVMLSLFIPRTTSRSWETAAEKLRQPAYLHSRITCFTAFIRTFSLSNFCDLSIFIDFQSIHPFMFDLWSLFGFNSSFTQGLRFSLPSSFAGLCVDSEDALNRRCCSTR